MKNYTLLLLALLACTKVFAQTQDGAMDDTTHRQTFTRGGITLQYYTLPGLVTDDVTHKLIEAFFKVYPQEVKRFNKASATEVIFVIDTGYKGVAATSGGVVRYNPQWFVKHPEDIDVVTHEVMHIVQSYGGNEVPGWLTEGIADYARYTYGVNNAASGWSLTPFKPTQSYTNAYRITARFLVWIEKNKYPKIVDKMDKAMRDGKYTPELWKKLTGKTVDELWQEYASNYVI